MFYPTRFALIMISMFSSLLLSSCSYNPLNPNNHLTGSPAGAILGGAVGAGTAAALGATTKPILIASGLTGAGVGYYLTTLRFASAGIVQAGGQVYQVGDYVTIEIPSDALFETNTADLLPEAEAPLKSAADIINRFPDQNVLVSGNTSGFGFSRWEQRLSEARARAIAAFLWSQGIQDVNPKTFYRRHLNYVGYGDYFPVATHLNNEGIRANSRIQITIYPARATPIRRRKEVNFTEEAPVYPQNIGCAFQAETTLPESGDLVEAPGCQKTLCPTGRCGV